MNKNILRVSPQSDKKQMKNSDCSKDNKTRRHSTSIRDECLPCCSSFCECLLIGMLLSGLILAIIVTLWLTSTTDSMLTTINSANQSSSTTISATLSPYCSDWLWNTTGELIAGITSSSGSASNQLSQPWNIYLDETNNYLYIADSANHRIQRWSIGSSTGVTLAGTATAGSSSTQLDTPKDVFVDSSQNIYVADSNNNRIQYFPFGSSTGSTVSASWSSPGSLWGVQVFNRSIYACSNGNSIIYQNGTTLISSLNSPQGFNIDKLYSLGTIYIVNSASHTIVKWPVGASSGSIVAGIANSPGSTSTTLRYPINVALDSYANLFVVDNNNHRIQLFCQYPIANTTGRTIAGKTGVLGTTLDKLNFPAGVALDSSLNLYVSDTSNQRILKFKRIR